MADTADNYLAWDDVEPVSIFSRSLERAVNVSHGKRTAISTRDAVTLGIELGVNTTRWSLPVALLNGLVPAKGDTITDSENVVWIVGEFVELLGQGSRYRMNATRSV